LLCEYDNTKPIRFWFTTKGQVVIPRRLRKLFHIEDGTRAIVTATDDGILLKPVTAAMIERGFGLLKRKPGDKPLAEEWAEHKREEREKEESKYARHVLDSFALIAYFRGEPAGVPVKELLQKARGVITGSRLAKAMAHQDNTCSCSPALPPGRAPPALWLSCGKREDCGFRGGRCFSRACADSRVISQGTNRRLCQKPGPSSL